jgi:hypothetical protein
MAKLKMKCFRSTSFLTVEFLYPVLILTASFQIFGNRMPVPHNRRLIRVKEGYELFPRLSFLKKIEPDRLRIAD